MPRTWAARTNRLRLSRVPRSEVNPVVVADGVGAPQCALVVLLADGVDRHEPHDDDALHWHYARRSLSVLLVHIEDENLERFQAQHQLRLGHRRADRAREAQGYGPEAGVE